MNNLHNKLKGLVVAILAVGATTIAGTAVAQQKPQPKQQPKTEQTTPASSFSDAELKQFIDANNRLMVIQQDGEKAMLAILTEEKLSVEKFSQMAKAHQEQKLNELKATPEELDAFNRSAQRMMELQPAMEQNMQAAIVKDGLTVDKYEQIMLALRQDPAMQAKVQKLMEQQ
ncbi:DUF4168 domain-containing protein [Pontibacter sp. Tf4]|uniref:DUF4168 domain-containing protein n=1 Tax=Pontibacter sp. Tf4 TaxID=2761620 RepID=UPI0016242FFB|nr:DUF4168 domain-containing protein [Pontibacter sp. Tf4]MBB6609442.1 DUF4168 domain-containing protein [Pontibacter sp. Tf4]